MIFLVTGGAGFIGSHIVELLVRKKHQVVVIDNFSTGNIKNIKHLRKDIKIVNASITEYNKYQKYFRNVDYVLHLAALADIVPSINQPYKYFDNNVKGTLNIVKACKKYKIKKIIYAASSSCYGLAKKFPTKESDKIDLQYPYAFSKYFSEKIIEHWSRVYNLNYISLRLFNVYGLRSRTSGAYGAVFGVFLSQKISNMPLTVVGDGSQSRDFVYVSDVANAFYKAAVSKINNQVFNVGTGKPVSINKIVKILNSKKINIPKRPGEPDVTHANINKIKKYLKWKPTYDIAKGVKLMLKNLEYWKDAPKWTPKKIQKETKNWFKYLK